MKLSEAIAAFERGEEVEWAPEARNHFEALRYFQFRLKPKPVEPLTEEERDKIHRISLRCGDFEYYKKDDVKFLLDLLKKQGVE